MYRYTLRWRRLDMDECWTTATPSPVPFAVCITIAKMITRISNGQTQIVIRDALKEKTK